MAEMSNTPTEDGELSSMQGGELSSMQCGGCEAQWDMSEHKPLVLPCGHCSCSSCCITQRRAGKLICRHCPHTFLDPWTPNTETPVNYFILELIASKNEEEETNEDSLNSNSNSSIVVPGLVKEPANQKGICVEHKLYRTFRCKVCSVDICQLCGEEYHLMESCQVLSISQDIYLNDLASETKQIVSKQSEVCQKKLEKILKCKMILDSEQKLIKEQIKNIQSEINKHNQVYETILKEKELLDLQILKNSYETLLSFSGNEESFIPDETTSNYAKKVMSEVSCCLVIRGLWQYLYGGVTSDRSLSDMHDAWSINMDTNEWDDWETLGQPARWTEQEIREEAEVTENQEAHDHHHDDENTTEQENVNANSVSDNMTNNEVIVNDALGSNILNEETFHVDGSENESRSRLNTDLHELGEINGAGKNVDESEKLEAEEGECSSTTTNDTSCNLGDQSNDPKDKDSCDRNCTVENSTNLPNTESQDMATGVILNCEHVDLEIDNQNNNVDSTELDNDNGSRNNDNEIEENQQLNEGDADEDNRHQSSNSIPDAENNEAEDLDEESSEESEEGNAEENQAAEDIQDKALWPHCFSDRYRIEVLVSIAGAVEPTRSVVWCAWRRNDGNNDCGDTIRWAKLTIRDGLLHLHHLQNIPPPPDSLLLMYDMVKSAISRVDSIQRCFLDLSWAGKERGRIYIEVHQRYTNPASLLKQLIQHFSGEQTPYTQVQLELKDKHFITLGDCRNWKAAPNKLLDRRSYFTGMIFVPEKCGGTSIEKPNLSTIPVDNENFYLLLSDMADTLLAEDSQTPPNNETDISSPNENPDTTGTSDITGTSENIVVSDQIQQATTSDAMPSSSQLLSHLNSNQTVTTNQNQERIRLSNASTPISMTNIPTTLPSDPASSPPLSLAILLRGSRISPPGPCLGSVTSGLSILLAAAAAVSAKHKVTITGCGLADNKCFEFYGQ